MKRIFLIIAGLLLVTAAFAADFMPTAFYRYATTKTVQTHTLNSLARKVSVSSNVATFWSYTTITGTGATARFPVIANTQYVFDVPETGSAKRMTFSGHTSAATYIYVQEQK